MINSRSLDDLLPVVAEKARKFQQEANDVLKPQGIELIITSTYRDNASQDALYAQGRTRPGRIVTNAKAGQSFHNYKVAFDIALLYFGKPLDPTDNFLIWDTNKEYINLWNTMGALGKACGLEWAGDWKSFKEKAHFQYTNGLSLSDLREGKVPK